MIDRDYLKKSFERYVSQFDISDERISLKIKHTFFVTENSDYIAQQLGLTEEQKNIAWAIAMLHDIGRFEQAARAHTFVDTAAFDHAEEGVRYLFEEGNMDAFLKIKEDNETLQFIRTAIFYHNKHLLPDTLSADEQLFCTVIRDADKLDIFRIFKESSFSASHEYPAETVQVSPVSEAVMECFERQETMDYSKRRYPADIYLSHFALAFGLELPCSRNRLLEQGYVRDFFDFTFTNPETQKTFDRMKLLMEDYLNAMQERQR